MNEKTIHRLFEWGIWLKGLHSLIEIVGGILIAAISTDTIVTLVTDLTADELMRKPDDVIANYLMHAAAQLSVAQKSFAAFYLLSHGVAKLFLVVGLIRNRLWAYPASLVVLALFIVYQMYRYTLTHAVGLLLLTVFDLVVIWLILHEYRIVRQHRPRMAAQHQRTE